MQRPSSIIWFERCYLGAIIVGLLGTAFSAISGKFPHELVGVLSVVGTILGALAVWFLFRPDTEAWFGEDQAA